MLEREWVARISTALVGSLVHGVRISPQAVAQIGQDLGNYVLQKANRTSFTPFGTLPRISSKSTYRAFTCFRAIHPLVRPHKRSMREHSMFTGRNNTAAFLQLEASIELDIFDLAYKDAALIRGFRQLMFLDPQWTLDNSPDLHGPSQSNPASTFKRLLLNQSAVSSPPGVKIEPPQTFWASAKKRLEELTRAKPSCQDQDGGIAVLYGPPAMNLGKTTSNPNLTKWSPVNPAMPRINEHRLDPRDGKKEKGHLKWMVFKLSNKDKDTLEDVSPSRSVCTIKSDHGS